MFVCWPEQLHQHLLSRKTLLIPYEWIPLFVRGILLHAMAFSGLGKREREHITMDVWKVSMIYLGGYSFPISLSCKYSVFVSMALLLHQISGMWQACRKGTADVSGIGMEVQGNGALIRVAEHTGLWEQALCVIISKVWRGLAVAYEDDDGMGGNLGDRKSRKRSAEGRRRVSIFMLRAPHFLSNT